MGRQDGGQPQWPPFAIEGVSGDMFAAALLRYGSDAVAVSERGSGRFVGVSDSYCTLTGYDRGELVGHTSVELGMFANHASRAEALGRVDPGPGAVRELRLRRKDGAVRVLEFSVQLLAGTELMLSISRDVTDRRDIEAQLLASEQRFRAAVQSMLDAFFILSPVRDHGEIIDFRYDYANDAHCSLVGLDREEIVDRRVGELFPAFVGSERFAAYRDALVRGQPFRSEDAIPAGALAGSRLEGRVLEISVVPVDENLVVTGRDITDRHQAEARVRALNHDLDRRAAELQAANRELAAWTGALERLAGGVAHEFNNKLAVIIGVVDVASDRLGSGHPLQSGLSEIRAAAEFSVALAKDMLAFAGRQMLDPRPVPVSQIASGVEHLLRPRLRAGIDLVLGDESGGAMVLVDRAAMERAVLALALNARDAIPGGGSLSIHTARTDAATPTETELGTVQISVTDTGVGIPDEIRARIFEPFFTTKEVGQGTGLELAAALGIVRQAGGTITVESHPGRGTTFVVELPQTASPTVDEDAREMRSPGDQRVVLVLEHDHDVRTLVSLLLRDAGHRVLEASNGERALAMLGDSSEAVEVMVTDMTLAGLNHAELAVGALALRPDLHVIYMSAQPEALLRTDGMPPGAFLAKPFTPQALTLAVQAAFTH